MRLNSYPPERGNMIFMILIAVILIGTLTVAIFQGGQGEGSNIDDETLIIKSSQAQSYASELERGIRYIMQNYGVSESDFRFAHSDAPSDYGDVSIDSAKQLFHKDGGGAMYRSPPTGLNDGSMWEFYGGTAAPAVGSDRADLMAVLPNVTEAFCTRINSQNDQPAILNDTGKCVHEGDNGRFDDSTQYADSPNTFDETDFAQDTTISAVKPAPQACVRCTDGSMHFYHVLFAR